MAAQPRMNTTALAQQQRSASSSTQHSTSTMMCAMRIHLIPVSLASITKAEAQLSASN
jgi:hypothetical protein